jgi:hypothetical protein
MEVVNDPIAPRAVLIPGDAVLCCPECDGQFGLYHSFRPDTVTFRCVECDCVFALTIEQREERLCFMWHWGSKK